MAQPETDDQRAERLLLIALEVATRIRVEHPNEVVREFRGLDYQELRDLALLASACIPVDRDYRTVVWWADSPNGMTLPRHRQQRSGVPECGTRRAFERHKRRGELVDLRCELAERRRQRERARLKAVA